MSGTVGIYDGQHEPETASFPCHGVNAASSMVSLDDCLRRDLLEEHLDFSGLHPGQIEEIVDKILQPLTITARSIDEILLPGGQLAGDTLVKQMNRHLQRGDRMTRE